MKRFYTARELAELKLSGWPETTRAFQLKAQREGWKFQPNIGIKGVRYAFADLPPSLQNVIIGQTVNAGKSAHIEAPRLPVESAESGELERRLAKMTIVAMFRNFLQMSGLPASRAEHAFIAQYTLQARDKQAEMPYSVYPNFSNRTLQRWRMDADLNPRALGGLYGKRKGTSIINRAAGGQMANYIATLITENEHLKAGHIRDLCRAKFGKVLEMGEKKVDLPSLRAFERHLCEWKAQNRQLHTYIAAPGAHKSHYRMALGDASEGVTGLNALWQIDASPADALCADGRYSVYAIIDVWKASAEAETFEQFNTRLLEIAATMPGTDKLAEKIGNSMFAARLAGNLKAGLNNG